MEYTRVYDPAGVLLGILENAVVQYTLKDVPLHSAKLTLPADDPANALCRMGNEVEIFDHGTRIELFRIINSPDGIYRATGGTVSYTCEHVAAYLIDDVLFQYHEIGGWRYGGRNENTRACMEYILERQLVKRWRLGICAFDRQFQYSFENETLLRALLAIPKQLDEEYQWTFDTRGRPWTVNLVVPDSSTASELRYARNMQEIQKSVDATELVTRLYALGYGEGVNQLSIAEVNGGAPYLDADTQGIWGIRSSVWVDRRFEIAESLLNRAHAILEEHKNPYISYKVKGVDLFPLTGEPFDRFVPGTMVRVNDQEHGILVAARVTEITKKDVYGAPGDIVVTIANKMRTAADTIADLANRAAINELYAQGSTCIYQTTFADNADSTHPAVMQLQIPRECVRINKLRLTWSLRAFRSYSQGAASGGGSAGTTESGGGGAQTSTASGGGTVTSASGGATQVTSEEKVSSTLLSVAGPLDSAGGSSMDNVNIGGAGDTGSGGGQTSGGASNYTTSGVSILYTGDTATSVGYSSMDYTGSGAGGGTGSTRSGSGPGSRTETGSTSSSGAHVHSMGHTHDGIYHSHSEASHQHGMSHTHGGSYHSHSMGHTHTLLHTHTVDDHVHAMAGHTHYMRHYHTGAVTITIPALSISIPSHTHTVTQSDHSHSVTVPSHSHSVTIPGHTHTLVPGIYDGPSVSGLAIEVDGEEVPAEEIDGYELDLTRYLAKDEDGKIGRGVWHSVTLTPEATEYNAAGLARIEAAIFVQTFVRSQGGGDY